MASWSEKARRRNFQIWEYHASHGCLLLRSPKGADATTNLDLLCFGIAYVELPRLLSGLEVGEPTPAEIAKVARIVKPGTDPWSLRILISEGRRFAVAATQFVEQEHDKEPVASFLAPRMRPSGRSLARKDEASP